MCSLLRLQYFKEIREAEEMLTSLRRKETFLNAVVTNRIDLRVDEGRLEHEMRVLGLAEPFEDLLSLPLRALTATRLDQTRRRVAQALNALEQARARDARDVWKQELRNATSKKRTRTT